MLLGMSAEQAASKDSLAAPEALDHIAAWIEARASSGGFEPKADRRLDT